MAYASPADMTVRFDKRVLGDLVSDSGVRVDAVALADNENLLAALDDASGEVDAALLHGKRYSTKDLESLRGNSSKYLIRLTCEIAFGLLWDRRPDYSRVDGRDEATQRPRRALERIRRGEHVFDVDENIEAGTPTVTTPSVVDFRMQNRMRDRLSGKYFPRRNLPFGS